jgi:hypothetical protein
MASPMVTAEAWAAKPAANKRFRCEVRKMYDFFEQDQYPWQAENEITSCCMWFS